MTPFEKQTLVIALKRMFDPERHFCICDFDSMLKVAGITITNAEREPLRLLHCIHYKDMPQDFRTNLARRVMEILSRRPDIEIDFEAAFAPKQNPLLEILPSPEPKGRIRKLLGL